MGFSATLREARRSVGLSQAELARRVGTSQSRLSSYESGQVTPSPATMDRLLAAARPLPSIAVDVHREAIKAFAARHGLSNVRVFGSIARGEDTLLSDVDLLVTPSNHTSLFDLAEFAADVEALMGRSVDVISDRGLDDESEIVAQALRL